MPSQQRRSAAAVNGSPPSAQTSTTTTQMEGSKNGCLRLISSEPAMLLFMCSAMAKFPVFQSLLYEKACLNSGRFGPQICQNISATHSDLALQKEANHLLLASSFCLLLPSIPIALLLGAMFDTWSSRKSQLIPLAGLLLADLNYMLQTIWPESSAYWLLLSDLFFGFAGGFTSIIGLLFAYSVRVTSPSFRSSRVAIMEGCMGLGGMCGYLLSGYLRQKFGYLWVFALLTAIHLVIFLYVLLFLRELVHPATDSQKRSLPPAVAVVNSQPVDPEQAMLESASLNSSNQSLNQWQSFAADPFPTTGTSTSSLPNLWSMCKNQIFNIASIYTVERDPDKMKYLNIVLLALGIELISFSGLMDILFSFLRFQLKWTDREYGLFNGFGTGLASFCVIFFYPLLQKQGGISNLSLALFGLITKIVSVLMLTFSSSTLLAMLSIIPSAFGRFISSALRAMASACVGQNEQGKVFSLISLLEAVAFLVASLFFNGLYPYTLNLFPGLMLLLVALLLLLPVGLLLYMRLNGMTGSI